MRVESRRLGTERLGVFFEWSTYDQDWREQTLAAMALNPQIPALYRNRMSVTPLMKFAFTPQVSVGGGVEHHRARSAHRGACCRRRWRTSAIGSVRYKQQWRPNHRRPAHNVGASFTVRAGTTRARKRPRLRALSRRGGLLVRSGKHSVLVSARAGRITGTAPMFERFSLGDSRTLRGWDKYDISPVGGDRMFPTSLEYRIHDVGAVPRRRFGVGRRRERSKSRFSTGVGFTPGPAVLHRRLPAEHGRVPRRVHDGLPRSGSGPPACTEATNRELATRRIAMALASSAVWPCRSTRRPSPSPRRRAVGVRAPGLGFHQGRDARAAEGRPRRARRSRAGRAARARRRRRGARRGRPSS